MKNLRYTGGDDIRELSPTDLQTLGVEDADYTLTFRQGVSTTVEDDVAEALLSSGRVDNLRESTAEELEQEEHDLEAALGFQPYDPSEHTVAQVSDELARSTDDRREYILDQEKAGQNRKGIFQAVGAKWEEQPAAEADDLDFVDEAATEAMNEAGGSVQETGNTGGTGSTAGGGTAGPANTSPSA